MNLFQNTEIAFKYKTDDQLNKAYVLFKFIQNPILTKIGNFVIKLLIKIRFPFIKTIVKRTLYAQFCGGENLDESLPKAQDMYQYGVSSILDYSVEGKKEKTIFDATLKEVLKNIEWAKEKIEIPFVVFKPTGFGRIDLYEKVGLKKDLSESETQEWERVVNRFETVAKYAAENKVPLMVDAEESWMQNAADEIIEKLMIQYNQENCLICNTLQMYRHDRLKYLKQQFEKAKAGNYFIGYKVVRGAYMEKERDRAKDKGYPSPIQPDKEATDRDYNLAVQYILENNNRISLYSGTHNEESCLKIIEKMKSLEIENHFHKVWFGQLYGMSDNLTYNLGNKKYNVTKYLPYGPVKEVVPYLIRRAEENTSVAGQTSRELKLIIQEINRRRVAKRK